MRHRHAPALSERDLAILKIEREFGQSANALRVKLAVAETTLGLRREAYTLLVNALVNDPAAEAVDPETIGRLRAVREAHRRVREDLQQRGDRLV